MKQTRLSSVGTMSLLLLTACSPFMAKPTSVVSGDNLEVLKGASILALIGRGYEIESVTGDTVLTKVRYAGSHNELKWQMLIRLSAQSAIVDTPSVNAEGEVHERVAEWMEDLRAYIEKAMTTRPPAELAAIGARYGQPEVVVSNAVPEGCESVGSVSATSGGMKAEEAMNTVRRLLALEGVVKGASHVVIETNSLAPMGFTIGYTLTGTAYRCPPPAAAPTEPAPVAPVE